MTDQNNNNSKVNYTREDTLHVLKQLFVEMIIEKEFPDIVTRAEELAIKFMEEKDTVEHNDEI